MYGEGIEARDRRHHLWIVGETASRCRNHGAVHGFGVRGAVQRLLLLLFDAFTNERSDLFIREIKDGIAKSGFRLSVRSLRNQ